VPTATMTSKGQLTVPAEVRERLGLHAGSRVDFVDTGNGTYELRVKSGSVRDLIGLLHYDGPPKTVEEMDEGIAAAVAERDRQAHDRP
jgi:antitoxin PrlF